MIYPLLEASRRPENCIDRPTKGVFSDAEGCNEVFPVSFQCHYVFI